MRNVQVHTALLTILFPLFLFFSNNTMSQNTAPKLLTPLPQDSPVATRAQEGERVRNLRQLPTTKSLQVVEVNPAATNGRELSVWLPGQGNRMATKTGGAQTDENYRTWFGSLDGSDAGTMTIIVRNGEITGSITTPTSAYRIVSLGRGVAALVSVDTRKFPPDEPPQKK